jgi:hypothetical protein
MWIMGHIFTPEFRREYMDIGIEKFGKLVWDLMFGGDRFFCKKVLCSV